MLEPAYAYRAKLVDVIDGDISVFLVDCGFDVWIHATVRFEGIDAYETTRRGSWDDGLSETEIQDKIQRGHAAKAIIRDRLLSAKTIIINTTRRNTTGRTKKEKYGRWLGIIWADGINLCDLLLEQNLAVKVEY